MMTNFRRAALACLLAVAPLTPSVGMASPPPLAVQTCDSAHVWVDQSYLMVSHASDDINAAIDDNDPIKVLYISVQLRHDVAALPYGPKVKVYRDDLLEALDEMTYQYVLLAQGSSDASNAQLDLILDETHGALTDLESSCGWSGPDDASSTL